MILCVCVCVCVCFCRVGLEDEEAGIIAEDVRAS